MTPDNDVYHDESRSDPYADRFVAESQGAPRDLTTASERAELWTRRN